MEEVWRYALTAAAAYLLGSLNGSLISSRLFWRDDIRRHGSGNAGATNVLRTHGLGWMAAVALWDVGKGAAAVLILRGLFFDIEYGYLAAGFFVIVGHIFPLFFGFRGGKGVFTTGAVALSLDWQISLIALGLFILVVVFTRYVSLGSICAVMALTALSAAFGRDWANIAMYAALALLVTLLHHANIKRLLKGTENKFSLKRKVT